MTSERVLFSITSPARAGDAYREISFATIDGLLHLGNHGQNSAVGGQCYCCMLTAINNTCHGSQREWNFGLLSSFFMVVGYPFRLAADELAEGKLYGWRVLSEGVWVIYSCISNRERR